MVFKKLSLTIFSCFPAKQIMKQLQGNFVKVYGYNNNKIQNKRIKALKKENNYIHIKTISSGK